jgi:hypothetical protein
MQPTSPATRLEDWADAIILRDFDDSDDGDAPEFALLETGGPSPGALLLACVWLSACVVLLTVLARPQRLPRAPRAEMFAEITLPPEPPTIAENSPPPQAPESLPPAPETEAPDPPQADPRVAEPPPVDPTPLAAPPTAPTVIHSVAEPRPVAAAVEPEKAPASAQAIAPPVPKLPPEVVSLPVRGGVLAALKLVPAPPTAARVAVAETRRPAPEALGALPLTRLLQNEVALAARLAALPSDQRLALPRVYIRVNAEWFQALQQTQERLYFSLTTPGADSEVLAYLSATNHFVLERPQRPLWQIRDGEQVPALAELRSAAARQLGAPASLVGIYTWHPPVLESALRMFVFERMRQLGVRLGPQDEVTVRLASGPGGCVMNLEPIRDGGYR